MNKIFFLMCHFSFYAGFILPNFGDLNMILNI